MSPSRAPWQQNYQQQGGHHQQQGGYQQHGQQQGQGGQGQKKEKKQQEPAPPKEMTAIQKAEARAKAAAAEAEKAAAEKKAAAKKAKAEKAAAEKAEAEKAEAEKAAAEKEAADKAAAEKAAAEKAAAEKAAAEKAEAEKAEAEKAAASGAEPAAESWEDEPAKAPAAAAPAEAPEAAAPAEAPADEDEAGPSSEPAAEEAKPKAGLAERDEREHLNLVFIGHVDAGKSTFCGQILYRTGQVDQRTIEKYEKEAKEKNRESWFLAFIMDTNEEERAKGKTVEVGRAHFESKLKRYTILDAPGHKNYVPNMIAGACQADVGVLVISARKGEFETGFEKGGQTREHALLAKTLGVRILLVVINKMDDPTVEYSQERFDECVEKLTPFLKGCGYNTKKDVIFVPISALTATNVLEKSPNLPWYDGPTFLSALDTMPPLERNKESALRLPILSKYKDMGTIVEGKVEQGTIKPGDKLWVMPNRVPVEVLNTWLDQDEVSYLIGGENARVKLKGIEDEDIQPGYVLSPRNELACATVRRFECQLAIVELLEHKSIFTAGYTAILHVHAIAEECSIVRLTAQVDKKTGKKTKKAPMFVKSGAVVTCVIETEQVVTLEPFDLCPQLGRFTLRDEGKTIGIGKVLDLGPDKEKPESAAQ